MLAQSVFSHKDLQGKSTKDMKLMLEGKGVVWGELPIKYKRGTYYQKVKEIGKFTVEEIDRIAINNPKHQAVTNPDFTFERGVVKECEWMDVSKMSNPSVVLFHGDDPIAKKEG